MRRILRLLFLVVFIATASACAIQPPGTIAVVPGERIDMRDVSFLPPDEHSWYVVSHESYGIALAAAGEGQDETFAVEGSYFEMPEMSTVEDLAAFLRPQLVTEATERFTLLEHELTPRQVNGLTCVETYLETEDRQAQKRTARTDSMRLRIAALYCLHPREKNVGLHLAYSNRHYESDGESSLKANAQKMFGTLRIEVTNSLQEE